MTSSNRIIAVKTSVRTVLASGRVSKNQLARLAGIRDTVLIGIEAEDWDPKSSTLIKLEEALRRIAALRRRKPARRKADTRACA